MTCQRRYPSHTFGNEVESLFSPIFEHYFRVEWLGTIKQGLYLCIYFVTKLIMILCNVKCINKISQCMYVVVPELKCVYACQEVLYYFHFNIE